MGERYLTHLSTGVGYQSVESQGLSQMQVKIGVLGGQPWPSYCHEPVLLVWKNTSSAFVGHHVISRLVNSVYGQEHMMQSGMTTRCEGHLQAPGNHENTEGNIFAKWAGTQDLICHLKISDSHRAPRDVAPTPPSDHHPSNPASGQQSTPRHMSGGKPEKRHSIVHI